MLEKPDLIVRESLGLFPWETKFCNIKMKHARKAKVAAVVTQEDIGKGMDTGFEINGSMALTFKSIKEALLLTSGGLNLTIETNQIKSRPSAHIRQQGNVGKPRLLMKHQPGNESL